MCTPFCSLALQGLAQSTFSGGCGKREGAFASRRETVALMQSVPSARSLAVASVAEAEAAEGRRLAEEQRLAAFYTALNTANAMHLPTELDISATNDAFDFVANVMSPYRVSNSNRKTATATYTALAPT